MNIKFENCKTGRQIVVRDDKGRLVSRPKQKRSGLKTKSQAIQRFKEKGSVSKNVSTLSQRTPRIGKSNITRIKTKDGVITIKQKIERSQLIGKNTALLKSKNRLKNQKHYQYIVYAKWGDKKVETVGYSDLRGTKLQAFERAKAGAIQLNLFKYDWVVTFSSEQDGFVTSPDSDQVVYFTLSFEVGTYVRTNTNTTTA